MLIFWRIRFNGGSSFGYQVLTSGLDVIGVYTDDGVKVDAPGDYTTIDVGDGPAVGVTPPAWAGDIHA